MTTCRLRAQRDETIWKAAAEVKEEGRARDVMKPNTANPTKAISADHDR